MEDIDGHRFMTGLCWPRSQPNSDLYYTIASGMQASVLVSVRGGSELENKLRSNC